MPSWSSNITARGTIAGPAGVALADIPERVIAFIIDAIILGIIGFIVSTLTLSVLGDNFGGIFGIKFAYIRREQLWPRSIMLVVVSARTSSGCGHAWAAQRLARRS